jgi:hypothetical protein
MSKNLRVLSLFVVIVLLLSAVGCGAATGRAALYGNWNFESSGTTMVWEFKSDGTFILHSDAADIQTKYEFVDDDTITIFAPPDIGGDDMTLDFKIEGDNLSLTSNGVTQVLTRVK